jgi:hypothetical protein
MFLSKLRFASQYAHSSSFLLTNFLSVDCLCFPTIRGVNCIIYTRALVRYCLEFENQHRTRNFADNIILYIVPSYTSLPSVRCYLC